MTGAAGGDTGVLALVGGDEFKPGNEAQDELLVRALRRFDRGRPAFVVASAAARQGPDEAVATARAWFGGLGLAVEELPLRTRGQAGDPAIVEAASRGAMFYLAGGDPGLVVRLIAGTEAWRAIVAAWRAGAVLAGSSAGAMAMGSWTLLRARHPGDARRDARPALGLVAGIAVAPHYETFGHRWIPEALPTVRAAGGRILGIDERTAAVWHDGEWSVLGPGAVTLIGAETIRYESGSRGLPLPDPG
jgi:cyanophycinase